MKNTCRYFYIVICLYCFSFISVSSFAQPIDTLHLKDSIKQIIKADSSSLIEKARRFSEKEINESTKEFKDDLEATKQQELLDAIKKESFDAREFVKKGIDITGFTRELNKIDTLYCVSSDGIFINPGTAQTYRNLATSKVIVAELLNRLNMRKVVLDAYTKKLIGYRNRIDSFATDSAMFTLPSDSAHIIAYFKRLISAAKAIKPADSLIKTSLNGVLILQEKVNGLVNILETGKENIEQFQNDLSDNTFQRDFPNLSDSSSFERPFKDIIRFSLVKCYLSFYFYINNNIGKLFILLSLVAFSFIFLQSLKKRLQEDNRLRDDYQGQLVLRYPLLSALIIVISLFQFIFIHPPFIFNFILWTISGLALTIIFNGFITRYWMAVWLTMFVFFIVAALVNLILQASRVERWIMLVFSLIGFLITFCIVLTGKKQQLRERLIIYFIGLASCMEFIAVVANMYGRYNFCKILLTTGFFNIVIGISFLWTVRLINEGLNHAEELYTIPERRLFYINFNRVGNEVPTFLKLLLVAGWFILFGRNFYAFRKLTDPVSDFLLTTRIVGVYSFSIQSILLFFGILLLATFISRVVSFFAGDQHDTSGARIKGAGSWLLLVRISIISIGLFIAFAAAGIPLDRITIILGALSVGIGFGLQALIQNLVSGVIISFERPVNVGDIIEIRGKGGTMKSIGFRSSVMRTWDGADIIIPNGDLLNEHLVNWTLNDSSRRIELRISVAYGTDLDQVMQLMSDLVSNDDRVAKSPAVVILAKEFGESAIVLELLFWAKSITEWSAIKSETIVAINKIFNEHNIIMPFPQQDVHIYMDKKNKDDQ